MANTQYGIGVTRNRFELFDDEEDPLEVLKKKELEKEARKKTQLSGKENSSVKSKDIKPKSLPTRKIPREPNSFKAGETTKIKDADGSKGTKRVNPIRPSTNEQRGNRTDVRVEKPQQTINKTSGYSRDDRVDPKFEKPEIRVMYRSGRGGVRPGMRGGGRNPRNTFDSRGKREFERQSGSDKTGVKAVDKREGGGAHNWGTHKDVLKEIQDRSQEDQWPVEKPEETNDFQMNNTENEEGNTAVNSMDDAARLLTLDEWKAQQAPRQKPTFNLRKAGEGEDLSRWKRMYVLQKKKEPNAEEEEEDEGEYEQCEYPQRVGRQKHILDIDIRFKDTRASRGRGMAVGRGGNLRNFHRGQSDKMVQGQVREPKEAPKVDDEHDFPSLN